MSDRCVSKDYTEKFTRSGEKRESKGRRWHISSQGIQKDPDSILRKCQIMVK